MSDILNQIAQARRAIADEQFDTAEVRASAVLDQFPSCLAAWRMLAWAQLELDKEEAGASFERCAALDPEDALAYVGQAICDQQRGDKAAATQHWLRAWELDPHNQAIRRGLVSLTGELPESGLADAIGLVRGGRLAEAIELLRPMRDESSDVTIALTLIGALWGSGAQREAFDLATAVYSANPTSVKAALFVGALEDRAGRTLRSREAMARAEQIDPGLLLFAETVRQVGLESTLEIRASWAPLAAAG